MKTSSRSELSSFVDVLEPRVLLSYAFQPLTDIVPAAPPTVLAEGVRGPLAVVDDLNGDGISDLLVGSMGNASGATILSGANGDVIRTHTRDEARFGWEIAALSDMDGDGTDDYAIGCGPGTGASMAFVYSGATGNLLYSLAASTPITGGATVAGIGDITGDGRNDVLVGFQGENRAAIFSGADGSFVRDHLGDAGDDISLFGVGLGGGADFNGDGIPDYVIAGHRGDHPGTNANPFDVPVYVFSGATGGLLRTITAATSQPDGATVVPTIRFDVSSDFNADGVNEIVLATGDGMSILEVSSGLALLAVHVVGNGSAQSAVVLGDLDRDGTPEIAVGFPTTPSATAAGQVGQVSIYSGSSGARLGLLTDGRTPSANARIGSAVAFGDVTGDGVADVIAVGDQNPAGGAVGTGQVYVFSGTSLLPFIPDGLESDPNGNFVTWGTVSGRQFLIRHNLLIPATNLTGFTVTDQIAGYATAPDGTELILGMSAGGTPFIWRSGPNFTNGARTDITGFTVVGDPGGTYSSMMGVGINGAGQVAVVRYRDGYGATGWLFDSSANTLTYLFEGTPHVINEQGNVIGLTASSTGTHYWTPAGLTTIDGLVAILMNDNNVIVGGAQREGDAAPRLYTWHDGAFTAIPLIDGGQDFTAQGINNDGVVVGVYRVALTFTVSMFIYSPTDMTTTDLKQSVDVDAPSSFGNSVTFSVNGVNNDGLVLGRMPVTGASFVLRPYDGSGPFTVDETAIISSTELPDGGIFVTTRNPAGEVIAFYRSPISGPWRRLDLAELAGVPRITGDVVTWYDPQENLTYIAAASEDGLLLITQLSNGSWQVRNLTTEISGAEAIVTSPVALQPQSGMTILGGLTAAGDLVIYGQTTQLDGQGRVVWGYDNLFNSVIRAQGLPVPNFDIQARGKLISYETSWDGLNIVGATSEGRPVAIWTAPGIQGWHVTDLADAAPDPQQVGDFKNMTVYITSWGGINIATGDNLKVLWWVPQFEGDWAVSSLRDVAGGPALRGETLSAYFAPWGGLNVAGLDENGGLWIYWWTPETDQWFVTQINPTSADMPIPDGNVSSLAAPNSLSVFARSRSGDLIHYLWQPDMWTVTDITLVAVA